MVERFVGLDVSQRLTSVCILDESGLRVWRGKCATDPAAIEEAVRTRSTDEIACRASGGPRTRSPGRGHGSRPPPENPRLLRSHSMASKSGIVRRTVLISHKRSVWNLR